VQRLETEAKTLSKMLSLETRSLWPPVIDHVAVEKGYEKALGAALGDDLDAPIDPSSPMHWSEIAGGGGDPILPEGAEPLARYVKAPTQLARRLAQVGVVERDAGSRLVASLKTGQRLVSRDGDLWRWDGFVVAAHAPTGAGRRLAQRSRFTEIDSELESARGDVEAKRRALEAAQSAFDAASSTETETRARERDLNRQAARLSALSEARVRLTMSRDEAATSKAEAESSLGALAPAADLETKLAQVRDDIAGKRAKLAEVQAEQQAIAREAELADRRLSQLSTDKNSWVERQQGARTQIATLEQRIAEARRDRTELENAPQIFAEKRSALITEVQSAEAERRLRDRLQQAENALADADRDARCPRGQRRTRGSRPRRGAFLEGAKRRLWDVGREIHDMLEIPPSAVAELAEIKPTDPLPDLAEIESTLECLRRERERLGAVNLRAEEELRGVESQHASLTTERDDLVEAIKKLRLGIQSLNREARERLLALFEQVKRATSNTCSPSCSAAAPRNCN
jgi:chromosome segregation protein